MNQENLSKIINLKRKRNSIFYEVYDEHLTPTHQVVNGQNHSTVGQGSHTQRSLQPRRPLKNVKNISTRFSKYIFNIFWWAQRAQLLGPKGPTVAAEGCSSSLQLEKSCGNFSSFIKNWKIQIYKAFFILSYFLIARAMTTSFHMQMLLEFWLQQDLCCMKKL